ncbi:MAG: tRNA epoxyqueuosine(34) reductase QueG [Deltaproteobacteria bacterium]|jgi:epoxyqueuosine reductase|nr:tRNA epoxyqueuosine(34) reductase QueG [Deltaproteobacteria bacterium]
METSPNITEQIFSKAQDLGFLRIAITAAQDLPEGDDALQNWIQSGYHGDMDFMAKHGRRDDPQKVLSGAKSLLVVALPYAGGQDLVNLTPSRPQGFIARYARGRDYHEVMREKLMALGEACSEIIGRPVVSRPCIDTAPLLERGYASQAGLGFVAKNTMLLIPGFGTYFLLGELLLDVELPPTEPIKPKCGSCRSCLDACPTGAFVSERVLDARKCVSYFTIEYSGAIPQEYRRPIGNMVFGCDICQEVCPYNLSKKIKPVAPEFIARDELQNPDLIDLLEITSSGHRRFVKGTALRRAPRHQLMRNAAIALGNSGRAEAIEPLAQALTGNRYPIVRGHVAWALGELGTEVSLNHLQSALVNEDDDSVCDEIRSAIANIESVNDAD